MPHFSPIFYPHRISSLIPFHFLCVSPPTYHFRLLPLRIIWHDMGSVSAAQECRFGVAGIQNDVISNISACCLTVAASMEWPEEAQITFVWCIISSLQFGSLKVHSSLHVVSCLRYRYCTRCHDPFLQWVFGGTAKLASKRGWMDVNITKGGLCRVIIFLVRGLVLSCHVCLLASFSGAVHTFMSVNVLLTHDLSGTFSRPASSDCVALRCIRSRH